MLAGVLAVVLAWGSFRARLSAAAGTVAGVVKLELARHPVGRGDDGPVLRELGDIGPIVVADVDFGDVLAGLVALAGADFEGELGARDAGPAGEGLHHVIGEGMGLHPYPTPVAVHSAPYNGFPATTYCAWMGGFGPFNNERWYPGLTWVPAALATGNFDLRTHCRAVRVLTDGDGRASGVEYVDANGNWRVQEARTVILCSYTFENVRLLLQDFYADDGVLFWGIYSETPLAAIAAFKKKPQVFGALKPAYAKASRAQAWQHGYVTAWLDVLREELCVSA